MALPSSLDPTTPTGAASPTQGDNQIRALKQLIADVFGLPTDPTSITAAGLSMTAGGVLTIVQSLFNTKAIVPSLGIITADTPAIDATVTWNNSAIVFHGLRIDVTDTSSDTTSRLLDLLVGGSSKFYVTKAGAMGLTSTLTLAADPTAALHAATKQYVDGRIRVPTVEIFAASGIWTKNADLLYARIMANGSGAGGGGVDLGSGSLSAAGGGGSGAYSESLVAEATLGATETVTIAAAGVGGVTGGADGQTGVAGGTASFGTHVVALGGSGGVGTTVNLVICDGGLGGLASGGTGTIKINGDAGMPGIASDATRGTGEVGGGGGGGKLGARSQTLALKSAGTQVGAAGNLYGGGGGGAAAFTDAATVAGGAGALGVVIVENFLA